MHPSRSGRRREEDTPGRFWELPEGVRVDWKIGACVGVCGRVGGRGVRGSWSGVAGVCLAYAAHGVRLVSSVAEVSACSDCADCRMRKVGGKGVCRGRSM